MLESDAEALVHQVEADFGVDEEEAQEEAEGAAGDHEEGEGLEQPLEAAGADAPHEGQPEQGAGSPGVEGLPEGELLSPVKQEPSAQQAEAAKRIAASVSHGHEAGAGGAAVESAEFDGWDADDGEGDWSMR